MKPILQFIAIFSALIIYAVGSFSVANKVQNWEVANNYPYGKLCDVFNNCERK